MWRPRQSSDIALFKKKKKGDIEGGEIFATLNVVYGSIAPSSPGGFLIMQTIGSHPRLITRSPGYSYTHENLRHTGIEKLNCILKLSKYQSWRKSA